jgi:hypothetical protein
MHTQRYESTVTHMARQGLAEAMANAKKNKKRVVIALSDDEAAVVLAALDASILYHTEARSLAPPPQ